MGKSTSQSKDKVSLTTGEERIVAAPKLNYGPRLPRRLDTRLALVGCGGIARWHLEAARSLGAQVVALCDPRTEAAAALRDEFFPQAEVVADFRDLVERSDIDAFDLATHPEVRVKQIEAALRARKHVLSQKPFVTDLQVGLRLTGLAAVESRVLAVNQNGRWAPHFAWLRAALAKDLLGDLHTLDLRVEWDHTWTRGTAFEKIHHLVLGDFGIHWFDMAATAFGGRLARSVFARAVPAPEQEILPPALASALIDFGDGLATLAFSAQAKHGPQESFCAVGSKGTLRGRGPVCGIETLEYHGPRGKSEIKLKGKWFPDGFRGSLAEFLHAVEFRKKPPHCAADNLLSLMVCFAAMRSASTGRPVKPGVDAPKWTK